MAKPLLVWRRQRRSRRSSTRHFSRTQAASQAAGPPAHASTAACTPQITRTRGTTTSACSLVGVRGPDVDRRGCARAGRRRRGDYVERGFWGGTHGQRRHRRGDLLRHSRRPPGICCRSTPQRSSSPGSGFRRCPCKRVPCGACRAGGRALDRGRSPRVAGLARGGDLCIGPAQSIRLRTPSRTPSAWRRASANWPPCIPTASECW